jgi:integration host factor subunit beta
MVEDPGLARHRGDGGGRDWHVRDLGQLSAGYSLYPYSEDDGIRHLSHQRHETFDCRAFVAVDGEACLDDAKCDIFGARRRIWNAQNPVENLRPWFRIARKAATRQDGRECPWGLPLIKSELAQRIAPRNPHLYQRDVENIVDAILEKITAGLARGEPIELRGFGAFSTKQRSARIRRNPPSGAPAPVIEKVAPFFRTGKEMRERLNKEQKHSR